jgi:cation transport ATPase
MTRQEQLKYCKTCLKRRFNPKKGVVCSLTDEIAGFDVTCDNYEQDVNVVLQDPIEKAKPKIKEKKQKPKRKKIPEKITKDDLFLILGIALAALFIIRLVYYFSLGYHSIRDFIIYFIVLLISISIALLWRKKYENGFRFFGDMKFKLLFTIIFTVFHLIYLIISSGYTRIGAIFFSNILLVFISSIASYLIVKPGYFIGKKISSKNEKIV